MHRTALHDEPPLAEGGLGFVGAGQFKSSMQLGDQPMKTNKITLTAAAVLASVALGFAGCNKGTKSNSDRYGSSSSTTTTDTYSTAPASTSTATTATGATGASSNASGIQVLYTIQPNGRYEYATLETHTMYSCETRLQLYKTGHIEMNGSQITFVPESGTFTSEDSCNRQYNYTKPAELKRETFAASVQRDEYGTKLCLVGNGINGCAYKRD
jgi:hypothetical protein